MRIKEKVNGEFGPKGRRFNGCLKHGSLSLRFDYGWDLMKVAETNEWDSSEGMRVFLDLTADYFAAFNCRLIGSCEFFPYYGARLINEFSTMGAEFDFRSDVGIVLQWKRM
jgi:hypothetical protein